ncbi:MAG: BlaI/MecI/CopY family transcriptional regulator [Bacteroidales bacterium]
MNKLTKAEEEVMLILWELEEATVRDVIERLDDPTTPYTTVSTVIRVLEKKEFVTHKAIGTTYLYSPNIDKEEYLKHSLSGFLNKYFEGSFTNLASFFATENDISMRDLREMIREVKDDLREDIKEENRK